MVDDLNSISEQLGQESSSGKDLSNPPLHLWHPELSGDIDIVIQTDGSWIHEGSPIKRLSLVNLFASILRREEDGEYYLVTPVEKWRLTVEALPLLVTDFSVVNSQSPEQVVSVTLNTGRQFSIDDEHPLFIPAHAKHPDVPAIKLPHGLAAMFARAAWYRLVEICEEAEGVMGFSSNGVFFSIVGDEPKEI
jgi:uncharacterized protein